MNEIKVYSENTVSEFDFFFSNEDSLVEHPEFFRTLFKVRRNYRYCFC